jgi:hypothetical protein
VRNYFYEIVKLGTHRMLRNGSPAIPSRDNVLIRLFLAEEIEARVLALDVVFLSHCGIRCWDLNEGFTS